jgi:hypothetical protein
MNLAELADFVDAKLQSIHYRTSDDDLHVANRLRAIHNLTRWIPVSERMPTKEDGKYLHVFDGFGLPFAIMRTSWDNYEPTHWKRIDKPEYKP